MTTTTTTIIEDSIAIIGGTTLEELAHAWACAHDENDIMSSRARFSCQYLRQDNADEPAQGVITVLAVRVTSLKYEDSDGTSVVIKVDSLDGIPELADYKATIYYNHERKTGQVVLD